MGPNMMIMGGSYRAGGPFARPNCDLACPIRSANPPPGPEGRSVPDKLEQIASTVQNKKSLHYLSKVQDFSPSPDHNCNGVCRGSYPSNFGQQTLENARSVAAPIKLTTT